MNTAVILAGGSGTRLGDSIPKQYLVIGGKPVICYCLEMFEKNAFIDEIVIVAAEEWREFILQNIGTVSKFRGFAPAGSSRQHSILLGLKAANPKTKTVVVHDAARPNVTEDLITQCVLSIEGYDGVLPVLPMKDTIILSENGEFVTGLLKRNQLFAGQTPESYRYDTYLSAHEDVTEEALGTLTGSCEIAFKHGLRIKMVPGDEHNFKITTGEDLVKFTTEIQNK